MSEERRVRPQYRPPVVINQPTDVEPTPPSLSIVEQSVSPMGLK